MRRVLDGVLRSFDDYRVVEVPRRTIWLRAGLTVLLASAAFAYSLTANLSYEERVSRVGLECGETPDEAWLLTPRTGGDTASVPAPGTALPPVQGACPAAAPDAFRDAVTRVSLHAAVLGNEATCRERLGTMAWYDARVYKGHAGRRGFENITGDYMVAKSADNTVRASVWNVSIMPPDLECDVGELLWNNDFGFFELVCDGRVYRQDGNETASSYLREMEPSFSRFVGSVFIECTWWINPGVCDDFCSRASGTKMYFITLRKTKLESLSLAFSLALAVFSAGALAARCAIRPPGKDGGGDGLGTTLLPVLDDDRDPL